MLVGPRRASLVLLDSADRWVIITPVSKRRKKGPVPSPVKPRNKRVTRTAAASAALVVVAVAVVYLWPRHPGDGLRRVPGQNVLLVTIDTLRADALGAYGGPARTPALDRLAAEGVRFDFAHAQAVLTLPSHATILTGLYPFQHGLRRNSGYRLPSGTPTAATILKKDGYATAAFIAAFPLESRFGLNVGFDTYDENFEEPPPEPAGEFARPRASRSRGSRRQWLANNFDMPERPASVVVPLVRDWIAARRGGTGTTGGSNAGSNAQQPWFVWVHLFDPHAPYEPPPPFDAEYASQPYYGEVAATDAALGPLFDDLRSGARSTLVVVTGDHGEGLGDHGETAHGIFAYESTLRIPLIIAEVGGARPATSGGAGTVSHVAARHIDILPTILDALGQPVPGNIAGRTLLPPAERADGAPPRITYFEAMSGMLDNGWAPLTGVIVGHEKFIDLPIPERYDLASDPSERSNLAGRSQQRDRTLAAALRQFGVTVPGRSGAEDPDAAARLQALGYVSADLPAKASYTEADDPKRLIELDNLIHTAIDAASEGRSDEAEAIYRRVMQRRPDMSMPYRYLALLEWQRGNTAGAIDWLRRAVASGVTDTRALVQLGEYLTEVGQVAECIKVLEPLAGTRHADADLLNTLGIAYATAGRNDDARRVFELMREVVPRSNVPLENLGVLALGRGDVADARGYFDQAIALAPGSSRAYAGKGACAFSSGDRDGAYAAWKRAVEINPDDFEVLYNLAFSLARDGRMDAASPYLEQFLRSAPAAAWEKQRREAAALLRRAH
jgi:arylsulfatase A-like enzyme/Flp pilus assembly protein TadD